MLMHYAIGDCEVVSESVQDPADKRARFHADASLSRGSPEWCNYIKVLDAPILNQL
jgi:hypothetical protein